MCTSKKAIKEDGLYTKNIILPAEAILIPQAGFLTHASSSSILPDIIKIPVAYGIVLVYSSGGCSGFSPLSLLTSNFN